MYPSVCSVLELPLGSGESSFQAPAARCDAVTVDQSQASSHWDAGGCWGCRNARMPSSPPPAFVSSASVFKLAHLSQGINQATLSSCTAQSWGHRRKREGKWHNLFTLLQLLYESVSAKMVPNPGLGAAEKPLLERIWEQRISLEARGE